MATKAQQKAWLALFEDVDGYGGKSGPLNYDVDEDDHVVIHAHTIEQLGSMRAIRRYLKAAEIMLPPFVVYADCGAVLTK